MSWLSQLLTAFTKPLKWWVVIAPWEQGVRVRLGKTAMLLQPGPHWRIPFVDRIYVQSIRLRTVAESNQTLSTTDGKVVVVSFAIRLAVRDMLQLYNAVANPELTLSAFVQAEVAEYVTTRQSTLLSRGSMEEWVNDRIGKFESWGLDRISFSVVGYAFVKTYRLLSTDYRTGSGLLDLEKENSGER